jgi:1,4-alpha-glucan branching enzyme
LSGFLVSPSLQADGVTFTYYDPDRRAARVALVGSFNNWDPRGYELRANLFAPPSAGLWQITIPSPPSGKYRYKFLVDDGWIDDPENPERLEDGYGGFASILEVPG